MPVLTIKAWLLTATERLKTAGIDTARLDCLVMLEEVTGRDRAWLLAHDEEIINTAALDEGVNRRASHEPLAYIRGHCEFYGRDFQVAPTVLVPRPETETIIDLAKALAKRETLTSIGDIGTGSGCIGITLKLELPKARVWLTDVYTNVYTFVNHNAQTLGADISFEKGDLLDALPDHPFDLIAANLPYVPESYPINMAATHEPPQAIYSGADGLDHYRRFWQQAAVRLPRYILTEALPEQHAALTELAEAAGYRLEKSDHFIQQFTLAT